jgi:metallo-beta-lactamase class B
MRTLLLLSLTLVPAVLVAQSAEELRNWNQPFPPHRIAGNLYYVGSNELGCYLVATKAGHILINTGFEQTVPLIHEGVEKLGFRFTDIRILLASQGHQDHVAGHARVRRQTGAKVVVMRGDEGVVADGGASDFYYADQMRWAPCPVDRVLADGDQVELGGTTLVAHRTAGHTKGCTTWTMTVTEDGKPLHVVIVGGVSVNPGFRLVGNAKYPSIADDFAATFRTLAALDCDVFLGAHGGYYGLADKYPRSRGEGWKAFVDPAGYREFVAHSEQVFSDKLRDQKAGK